jgi:hypothetical protein
MKYEQQPRSFGDPEGILPSIKAKLIDKAGNETEWPLVEAGLLRSYIMIESTNMFLPVLQLVVLDRENILLGAFTLTGADRLQIDLGDLTGDDYTYKYELFSIQEAELRSLLAVDSMMTITFWPLRWKELFKGFKVRGFSKIPASTVASNVVTGVKEKEIEPSKESRNYIQAQWTDAQFLRHLAQYAVGKYSAGYWYFFDRYDKFFFCTPAHLLMKPLKPTHKFEYVNDPESMRDLDREFKPILAWRLTSNYKTLLLQSGYGSTVKWFDYDDKAYKESTILYTNTELPDFVDWVFMSKDDMDKNKVRSIYQGNMSKAAYSKEDYRTATRNISNAIYNLLSLEIIIRGDKEIRLGDKVQVNIPAIVDLKGIYRRMDTLSGYWLISKISHMLEVNQRSFLMKLVLLRSGINKPDEYGPAKQLVAPAGRKVA